MITYRTGNDLDLDAVIELYVDSTLGARRPVSDRSRMQRMLAEATLVITAWEGARVVGISRSLTDLYYPHIGFEHHPQAWILRPRP